MEQEIRAVAAETVQDTLAALGSSTAAAKEFAITAIVPAHNRFHSVQRTLDSILRQTLQPSEIIVVDDVSATPIEEFLRPLGYLDRVRVLRLERNSGPGEARNCGAREAETDWVAFLDSDDEWNADCLERLCGHLRETPDCDGVDGPMLYKFPDREVVFGNDRHPRMRMVDAVAQNQIYNQMFLVKRAVMVDVGYDPSIREFDDYALSLRLAGNGYNIDHISGEPVGTHFRLGENMSGKRWAMFRGALKVSWQYRGEFRKVFGPGAMIYQSGRVLFMAGRKIRKVGIALRVAGRVLMGCVPWAPRVEDI